MKKVLVAAIATALVLVSFTGCKKDASSEISMDAFMSIALENDDDCAKAATESMAWVEKNGNALADAIYAKVKAEKDAGKNAEEALNAAITPSEDLMKKLEASKCGNDPGMGDVGGKLSEIIGAKVKPLIEG